MRFAIISLLLVTTPALANMGMGPTPNDIFREQENLRAHFNVLEPENEFQSFDTGTDRLLLGNRADAINWAKAMLPMFQGAFDKDVKILETHENYAELESITAELWAAYTELLPQQTAGLNVPPVIILDTLSVNAFVTQDGKGKVAHAIVVLSGFLDLVKKQDNWQDLVRAVFAHELAHSVFKHALPQYANKINRFYDASTVNFGFLSQAQKELDTDFQSWLAGARLAGDITSASLQNLPSPGMQHKILFSEIWDRVAGDTVEDNPACRTWYQARQNWAGAMGFSYYRNQFVLAVTPAELDSRSQALINSQDLCFKKEKINILKSLADVLGVPVTALDGSKEAADLVAEVNQLGFTQSLRKEVGEVRTMMQGVEAKYATKNIGYYTFEEQADEMSAIILKKLGKNPGLIGSFFMTMMIERSPNGVKLCEQVLANGQTPVSGSFSDVHRSNCFRRDHLVKFSELFNDTKGRVETFVNPYLNSALGVNY